MSKIKARKYAWPFILILLLQLTAIIYIKYSIQNLSLSEFKVGFIGNLFLLIIYLFLVVLLLFNSLREKKSISNIAIITYLIFSWMLLIISFISTKLNLGLNNIYLFGQVGNKLLTGLLFVFFLVSLFSFLLYTTTNLFTKSNTSIIKNIYGSVLMLLLFLLVTFIYNNTLGYTSEKWQLNKNKRNIAVVLGAAVWSGNLPSPTLTGRVEKALELLNNGFTGKILVTGSSAPGELTEAEVAYNYLAAKGVDTSIVSIETSTRSTAEQIQFLKRGFSGLENLNDIIVISDSYHLPRVIEISRFFNLDIKVAESRHVVEFKSKLYNKVRESVALFIFWCFAL